MSKPSNCSGPQASRQQPERAIHQIDDEAQTQTVARIGSQISTPATR